jgi:hypothetical protein
MAIIAAGSLRTALSAKLRDRGHPIMSGGVTSCHAGVSRSICLWLLEPQNITS